MKRVCLFKTLVVAVLCLNAKCAKFFRKVCKVVTLYCERGWLFSIDVYGFLYWGIKCI